MKIYISLDQSKIIRDALYSHKDYLRKRMEQHDVDRPLAEHIEALLVQVQMLTSYFKDQIASEEETPQ